MSREEGALYCSPFPSEKQIKFYSVAPNIFRYLFLILCYTFKMAKKIYGYSDGESKAGIW